MEFQLNEQEYIELNVLLKLLNLVDSGGMAKMLILDNQVKVNNQVENRIRRKLRVQFAIDPSFCFSSDCLIGNVSSCLI